MAIPAPSFRSFFAHAGVLSVCWGQLQDDPVTGLPKQRVMNPGMLTEIINPELSPVEMPRLVQYQERGHERYPEPGKGIGDEPVDQVDEDADCCRR